MSATLQKGAFALIFSLSFLGLFLLTPGRANANLSSGGISADTSTGQFECKAMGTFTQPGSGGAWRWNVYVDGQPVDVWVSGALVGGTVVPYDLDLFEPHLGGLHGFHTCEFVAHDADPVTGVEDVLWDFQYSYTFP